jgi:hypothetical protein
MRVKSDITITAYNRVVRMPSFVSRDNAPEQP